MIRLLAACLALAAALAAHAQPYPTKPLKLVVPHAPGGNSDTFGRVLAAKLSERLGQQVVVENRAGAGGTVASEYVARSAPDGYTLLVGDNGTHGVAPTLYAKLPYKVPGDFTSISLGAMFPTVLLVHPAVKASNVKEFVALAKSQPGKLTYSSAGTGNGSHLTVDMFLQAAGNLELVHVPYKGGAPAVQALLAGDVQLTAVSVNTSLPHIKSGKLRALAIASSKYLLRWRPEDDKSAFLAQAGYTPENADRLMADIREQSMSLETGLIENTGYGPKFALAGVLTGPNGRALRVVTIWMTEEATGKTKFITLYPDKT